MERKAGMRMVVVVALALLVGAAAARQLNRALRQHFPAVAAIETLLGFPLPPQQR